MSKSNPENESPSPETLSQINELVYEWPTQVFQTLNKVINKNGYMVTIREIPDAMLTEEQRIRKQENFHPL